MLTEKPRRQAFNRSPLGNGRKPRDASHLSEGGNTACARLLSNSLKQTLAKLKRAAPVERLDRTQHIGEGTIPTFLQGLLRDDEAHLAFAVEQIDAIKPFCIAGRDHDMRFRHAEIVPCSLQRNGTREARQPLALPQGSLLRRSHEHVLWALDGSDRFTLHC